MKKKCKLIANFGLKYGEETETIIDLGDIYLNEGTEQFPLYEIAQSLNSDIDLRDKFLTNLTVLYNQGISSYGTSNITLSDLVSTVPVEGGWPSIEELEGLFNITYIDKNLYGERGLQQNGKNIKVYRNGLPILRGILLTQGIIKRLGANYLFTNNFNIVYNKLKKEGITSEKLFIEQYILSPEDFPYEITIDEDLVINVPQVVRDEIDRIVGLVRLSKSDIVLEYSDTMKAIAKRLSPKDTPIIEFIISYLNDPTLFPISMKYKGEEIDISTEINKEVDTIMSNSLSFNTEFLNKLYALIKLNSSTSKHISLSAIRKLFSDPELKADEKLIKLKLNKEINKDKEFPYKLGEAVYNTDYDSGTSTLSGFDLESIYPDSIGKILDLDYKGVYEKFKLIDTYSGYNIYKHEGRYYISKTILTNYSRVYSEPFSTIYQAKLKILELANSDTLKDSIIINPTNSGEDIISMVQEKYGFVPKEGSVIKVMIADTTPGNSDENVYNSIETWKYSDFINFLNLQLLQIDTLKKSTSGLTKKDIKKIKSVVKNSYLAKEFLLCFYKKLQKMSLDEILEHIKKMRYLYYMTIRSKFSSAILVKIDPTKELWPEESTDKKSNTRSSSLPKREVINNIVEALNKKLEGTGFEIILMTLQEIHDLYGEGRETANGFVSGNKIIINSTIADITTPIHEYIHVFLGMLKAIDYNKYRNIVENCLRNWASRRDLKESLERRLARLRNIYGTMSEYDIQEELFADMYAEYIYRQNYKGFMEALSDDDLRFGLADIFEVNSKSIQFKNIWRSPLGKLSSLLSQCRVADKDRELWFLQRFQLNREAANWIKEGIDSGKIKLDCT